MAPSNEQKNVREESGWNDPDYVRGECAKRAFDGALNVRNCPKGLSLTSNSRLTVLSIVHRFELLL